MPLSRNTHEIEPLITNMPEVPVRGVVPFRRMESSAGVGRQRQAEAAAWPMAVLIPAAQAIDVTDDKDILMAR